MSSLSPSPPPSPPSPPSRVLWKVLRKALLSPSFTPSSSSHRPSASTALFTTEEKQKNNNENKNNFNMKINISFELALSSPPSSPSPSPPPPFCFSLSLCVESPPPPPPPRPSSSSSSQSTFLSLHKASRESGIDLTGLKSVWEAEFVTPPIFVFHMLKGLSKGNPSGKSMEIVELGGGFSCLASPIISHMLNISSEFSSSPLVIAPLSFSLSDGQSAVLPSLVKNSQKFAEIFPPPKTKFSAFSHRWGEMTEGMPFGRTDILFAADCLFFEEFHGELIDSIEKLLGKSTQNEKDFIPFALFVAPNRNKTLNKFLIKLKEKSLNDFKVSIGSFPFVRKSFENVNGEELNVKYSLDEKHFETKEISLDNEDFEGILKEIEENQRKNVNENEHSDMVFFILKMERKEK